MLHDAMRIREEETQKLNSEEEEDEADGEDDGEVKIIITEMHFLFKM